MVERAPWAATFRMLRCSGIYVAMSVGLGVVMTKVIEAPVLRWRERWFPPRGA